ncbi:MAG: phosphoribosyltransferase [Desulfitobacteriaceae bacterium]|nr:phosphoribosyltransferase [Desulfitobacteriaceae bacterium]
MIFANREDAGKRLAAKLLDLRGKQPVVLGIPRGGIIVAAEVAKKLDAPLDLIIPRKIGAPGNRELAVGAVAPDVTAIFDERALAYLGLQETDLKNEIARQSAEIKRRAKVYRGNRRPLPLQGKTVILVDDGIATGLTAKAALQSVRKQKPESLVLAVPVASIEAADLLIKDVDEFICLLLPDVFYAVGQFYDDFSQTTDEEVTAALDNRRTITGTVPPRDFAGSNTG